MAISVGLFNQDTGADIFLLGRNGITAFLATMNLGLAKVRRFRKNYLFALDPNAHIDKDYRTFQIKIYDADRDGLADIIAIYGKQDGLKWMKQLNNSRIRSPLNLVEVNAPTSFDIGKDVNKDTIPDVVTYSSKDLAIYLNVGMNS